MLFRDFESLSVGCNTRCGNCAKCRTVTAKPDISNLSLEVLSSTEITSVSRKEHKLSEAAAAIFVITSEDIRRSMLNNIAELLRTVPGLDVAEIDANKWSITSRGFGERYPDKMFVTLDGRTLCAPYSRYQLGCAGDDA